MNKIIDKTRKIIKKIDNIYKKITSNGFVRLLIGIFKFILYTFILIVIAVIIVQRVTNNNTALGGYRLFTVVTESMSPVYNVGDMLLAKEVEPSSLFVGDDVVYNGESGDFKGKIVVHRVIEKGKLNGLYRFTTKGVANINEDPDIYENQIIGKVIYRTTILSFISKIVNNVYGFYFVILVPFAIVIFFEVIRAIDEKKEEKKELAYKKEQLEKEKNKEEDELL